MSNEPCGGCGKDKTVHELRKERMEFDNNLDNQIPPEDKQKYEQLKIYSSNFSYDCLHTVQQFLNFYKWDIKHERMLLILLQDIKIPPKKFIDEALLDCDGRYKKHLEESDSFPPLPIIDICPKCNSAMGGQQTMDGENKSRIMYKECMSCSYIEEIWKENNKYWKTKFTIG